MQAEQEQPVAVPPPVAAPAEDIPTTAGDATAAADPSDGPIDPLPSPEEIAAAAAAAGTAKASSAINEPTAQPPLKGLGKGLAGAGLGSRKAKGNGGGSTISAATAPAALAVRNRKGGSGAPGADGSSSSAAAGNGTVGGSSSKDRKPVSASAAVGGNSSRTLSKGGAESFNLNMSTDAVDDDESGEWESASTDEEVTHLLNTAGTAAAASGSTPRAAAAAKPMGSSISGRGPKTWQQTLYETFDETTVLVCGTVLGLCAGSLLLLGGKVYLHRQS
eukprot:GHUV01006128.1.p1 GENE.GHUV01006128.1~~GHUV01006128.1.p1  ORF type:complete len:276 (+),score=127.71 GHUV01006128.1:1711-2538(+)